MCTVTFIRQGDQNFITSNRDEAPYRDASGIFVQSYLNTHLVFPKDPISGGSWIVMGENRRAVCLLNGGFTSYIPREIYRISRGTVVLDASACEDIELFFSDYDLVDVAPFTLVVFDNERLFHFTWTGEERFVKELNIDEPHIWSSATLYSPEVRKDREDKFKQWLVENPIREAPSIISFHLFGSDDPENGFVMNRNEIVKTLSVTQICLNQESGTIRYSSVHEATSASITIKKWKS